MNRLRAAWVVVCLLLVIPASFAAQTSTSTVLGTVKDPQDAVVVGAQGDLEAKALNCSPTPTSNSSGPYIFVNVIPGIYTISVTVQGFSTASVKDFRVEVATSYTIDLKLQLGQATEVMTVSSEVVKDLRTTDSTVGNVISGNLLPRMPALTRRANELMALQPT